jgi:hypothetical protein
MKLTLKPHPACKEHGELIDVYNDRSHLPWGTVHIDAFWKDTELYERLYKKMEVVEVELVVKEQLAIEEDQHDMD